MHDVSFFSFFLFSIFIYLFLYLVYDFILINKLQSDGIDRLCISIDIVEPMDVSFVCLLLFIFLVKHLVKLCN